MVDAALPVYYAFCQMEILHFMTAYEVENWWYMEALVKKI